MNAASTLSATLRAIGRAKNGIGVVLTFWNTSFISSGGIALPSAKCSQ